MYPFCGLMTNMEITTAPTLCSSCPNGERSGVPHISPRIVTDARIMCVLDFHPGNTQTTEILFSTPGKAVSTLFQICSSAGLDFNSVSFAAICPCIEAQRLGLSYTQYRNCGSYLYEILPDIVIAMGLIPLRSLLGQPMIKVEEVRNKVLTLMLPDREVKIIPTYSIRSLDGGGCGGCKASDVKRTLMIKDFRSAASI